ncbi:hypothetical protein BDB00DRAFT_759924 [Zychaea mexicana]|uniref:uncharacterized protein n=1 Tax=Zychaea mexicana TaxID=64656 RepID=UPI0022FF0419|nr:uncharacterized protein BDB00DRAFT_759924 [Zychaea mexicana]KAI9495583.1 hypothetical protein BDB00DRAFT_759924 [Zychaea mexicana]
MYFLLWYTTLENQAQIIQFLNLMYLTNDQGNGVISNCKDMITSEVMNIVKKYSIFFDDKTIFVFRQQCG